MHWGMCVKILLLLTGAVLSILASQTFHVDIARQHRKTGGLLPKWTPNTLQAAINSKAAQLGYPLAVTGVQPVPYGFSARFDSISKTYLYRVYFPQNKANVLHAPPLANDGTAWFVRSPLDVATMHAVARVLQGKHNCSVLRSAGCQAVSPVKTLQQVSVQRSSPGYCPPISAAWAGAGPFAAAELTNNGGEACKLDGDLLSSLVHGDGGLVRLDVLVRGPSFLYNMVRNIAGLLVWVGQGHASPQEVATWLREGSPRSVAKYPTAPAHGLTLLGVEYPDFSRLLPEVQRDQTLLCPALSAAASAASMSCGGACQAYSHLGEGGSLSSQDAGAALRSYAVASSASAECCRALHSARRVRTMHRNGNLDADGWSDEAHEQLVRQYGGRGVAGCSEKQAEHEADWHARRGRASQRSARIIALTAQQAVK